MQSKESGHTPLHSASFHGHFEAAQLLITSGADVTLVTSPNINNQNCPESCAQWAAENGHDDLAHWLNTCRSNGEGRSGCSSSEGSYVVSLPSKVGKIKSVTQEKIGVLSLRAQLPKHLQIDYQDIDRLEHIGSGSFGRVFRARLKSVNQVVALKVYKHHNHSSKTDIDMFVREVKILSHMQNPYIVKFYGVCLDDASNFSIITEFCSNGSLNLFLHKQKRCLDLGAKLVILHDVAAGMNYLHTLAEPVIHRDLNSFNILLRDSMNAVVADFGESRFIGRREMLTKQPGNLRWMAPEVFNQSTEYSTKADVFNFALCIWELLSAELPFFSLTPLEAAQQFSKGSRPSVSPTFPEDLVFLMTQCWASNPLERPSFFTIAADLEIILSTNQIRAGLPSFGVDGGKNSIDLSDRRSVAELRSNFELSPSFDGAVLGLAVGGIGAKSCLQVESLHEDMNRFLALSTANGYVCDVSQPRLAAAVVAKQPFATN